MSFFTNWDQKTWDLIIVGTQFPTDKTWRKDYLSACTDKFKTANLIEKAHPRLDSDNSLAIDGGIGIWSERMHHVNEDEYESQI